MTTAWKWPAKAREGGCSTVRTATSAAVLALASFPWLRWWPVFPHVFHLHFTLYLGCFNIVNGISLWLCAAHACVQKEALGSVNSILSKGPASCGLETPALEELQNSGVRRLRKKGSEKSQILSCLQAVSRVGRYQEPLSNFYFVLLSFWLGSLFLLRVCEVINFNRYLEHQTTSYWKLIIILSKHKVIKTSHLC